MSAHDVFVCHSSKDERLAIDLVGFLEARQVRCWMSPRNIEPGRNYQEAIVEALHAAKVIVFLFSEQSAASNEIKKELSLGASANIPVIPLRLAPITPSGALRYELATRQWIDAFPNQDESFERLLAAVQGRLHARAVADAWGPYKSVRTAGSQGPTAPTPAQPDRTAPAPILVAGSREFEAIRGLLAHHIGPIAKVLMQRAASNAKSGDEFCAQLAAHVPDPDDRAAFLRAARQKLGA